MSAQSQKAKDLEDRKILDDLLRVAREVGLRVRTERGSFRSGQCLAQGEDMLILNRRLSIADRASVLARELVRRDLSEFFLLPKSRELLEAQAAQVQIDECLEESPKGPESPEGSSL